MDDFCLKGVIELIQEKAFACLIGLQDAHYVIVCPVILAYTALQHSMLALIAWVAIVIPILCSKFTKGHSIFVIESKSKLDCEHAYVSVS